MKEHRRTRLALVTAGIVLFVYALLGNYIALPGYLRFLGRGGTTAAGSRLDFAFVLGASKTILWMYSFQLGAACFAFARALARGLPVRALAASTVAWLVLWSVPSLPAPGAWFYVVFGCLNLLAIAAVLSQSPTGAASHHSEALRLAGFLYFAFATWEICGLGSSGRMLHPEEAAVPFAHRLLVTQSSKLMIEFVAGWTLMVAAGFLDRRPAGQSGATAT